MKLYTLFAALLVAVVLAAPAITDYLVDRQFEETSYTPAQVQAVNNLVKKLSKPPGKSKYALTPAERNRAIAFLYGEPS